MNTLEENIKAFEKMNDELKSKHMNKWVLFYDCKLIDIYDSFENASNYAIKQFGSGPYLIRQVGAQPIILPVNVFVRNDRN